MKIPCISTGTIKGLSGMKRSFSHFSSAADKLIAKKTSVTGLLPNSMKKSRTTGLTTPQLIDLILKNL